VQGDGVTGNAVDGYRRHTIELPSKERLRRREKRFISWRFEEKKMQKFAAAADKQRPPGLSLIELFTSVISAFVYTNRVIRRL
jgi:hypothetical protein